MSARRLNFVMPFRGVGRVVIALLLAVWQASCSSERGAGTAEREPLVIYCAASNKSVLEAIRADYEAAFHVPLQIQYGPSQTLLASMQVSNAADLYLPADDSYITMAREKKLIAETFAVASMRAVVAVPKGNPKKIESLAGLLESEVRLSQANPDGAAIGKLTKAELSKQGLWEKVHEKTSVYKTTVNEVANDVKVGALDAGIVFDAVLSDYPTLEAVTVPELDAVRARIVASVVSTTKHPRQALHFARYLAAKDKGLAHYRRLGFQVEDGDEWSDKPEVTLYAGSMLRTAVEKTIVDFEEREGVSVTRVYNGCGILVAQMKAGQVPDAYFACDIEFMKQVQPLFPDSLDVSQNELVIVVPKGNPKKIGSLRDLSQSGLRVGIGHEKQCAMGWITQRTFKEGGVQDQIMKNVVVQTPTGDMLVNQMRTGALDVAVAYLSNLAGAGDALDAVRITGLPCSVATQPFGVRKDAKNRHLVERLLAAIRAEGSRSRFEGEGFRWVDEKSIEQKPAERQPQSGKSVPEKSASETAVPAKSVEDKAAP